MKILLTGTSGKVGGALAQDWKFTRPDDDIIPLTRSTVDLSDSIALENYLQQTDFDLLVNPAALSTPEACEDNHELAIAVNVDAPKVMAQVCKEKGARLIHFSTDYVLCGKEPDFKTEKSPTRPNNHYGATKLAGEEQVLAACENALVARVSWVFATAGEAFLEKILRLLKEEAPLEAVADKYSMPTSAPELFRMIDFLLEKEASGLFHLTQTADEPISWYRYACEVVAAAHELELISEAVPVTPRKMDDIPVLRTGRPRHTSMQPERLQNLEHPIKPWTEALRDQVTRTNQNI